MQKNLTFEDIFHFSRIYASLKLSLSCFKHACTYFTIISTYYQSAILLTSELVTV